MSKVVAITQLPKEVTEQEITSACESIAGNVVNIRMYSAFAIVEFETNRLTSQLKDLKLLEEPVKVFHRKHRGLADLKYVLQIYNLPEKTEWKQFFTYIKFAGQIDNLFMSVDGTKADVIFTSRNYKLNAKNYLYLVPFKYTAEDGEEKEVKLESIEEKETGNDEVMFKRRRIEK